MLPLRQADGALVADQGIRPTMITRDNTIRAVLTKPTGSQVQAHGWIKTRRDGIRNVRFSDRLQCVFKLRSFLAHRFHLLGRQISNRRLFRSRISGAGRQRQRYGSRLNEIPSGQHQSIAVAALATGLRSTPTPSTSTSITSPACIDFVLPGVPV